MLNLGTASAVLYFARYKKPWAFAAASIALMILQSVRTAGLPMDLYQFVMAQVRTGTSLGNSLQSLLPNAAYLFLPTVATICAAIPSLVLCLYLRRAFRIAARTMPQD